MLQVPVVFGHWLIEGNKLVCRLPRKNVTVKASKKLLVAVMHSCDGSRSWADVFDFLKADWDASTLKPFMQALVQDGVLVESSLLWAHWADTAQLPTTTGTAATNEVIGALHKVAEARLLPGRGKLVKGIRSGHNTLAQTFCKRQSTRTFNDKSISVECLCSILWAAHGVTQIDETSPVTWRRTIASGGNMHSARWFVVVLRELVSEEVKSQHVLPGIYEARFHQLGGASLHKLPGAAVEAWRCLRDPRVLRFASALVLPVYDMSVPAQKYGNRATLYAVMESGQALQNAQLMAFELGASGMVRGDTIAHESLRMLALKNGSSHWLSVPAMVVGAQARPEQLKQQQLENVLKITPNVRFEDDSFAFAANISTADNNPLYAASGRSRDPKLALIKAEAECWERYAWACPVDINSKKFQVGRFADIEGAIDPNALTSYSQKQYAEKSFPFVSFSKRKNYLWVDAINIQSGKSNKLLADCVYASSALPVRFQKNLFTSTSTSGMAAGTSQEDALCRATLELIERDAFVCQWMSRRAPPIIKSTSLPQAAVVRIKALTLAGFRVVVSDISTSWAPAVSVFAQNAHSPFTTISAAANFSAEAALYKALDEIEGRIAHAQNFAIPTANDKGLMRQIERYYRSRKTYKNSDFYVDEPSSCVFNSVGGKACQSWSALKSRIHQDGFNLLASNMTINNSVIEQGRVPLYVIRAVVPGLVPIWFQIGTLPESMLRLISSLGIANPRFVHKTQVHPFT